MKTKRPPPKKVRKEAAAKKPKPRGTQFARVKRAVPRTLPVTGSNHSTVMVEVGDRKEASERKMALVHELWSASISKDGAEQEPCSGKFLVNFPNVKELAKFLNIVSKYENGADSLHSRMSLTLSVTLTAPCWEDYLELMDLDYSREKEVYEAPSLSGRRPTCPICDHFSASCECDAYL